MLKTLILLTCLNHNHCDLIKIDDNITPMYCQALAQKSLPPSLEGGTLTCVDAGPENNQLRTSEELTALIKAYIPPVETVGTGAYDGNREISL